MVSINKSFFYGICFASLTWIILLCLYSQLNSVKTYSGDKFNKSSPAPNIDRGNDYQRKFYSKYTDLLRQHRYVNSESIRNVNRLQPVSLKTRTGVNDLDITDLGLVRTVEDQLTRNEGYKLFAFNVLVSNRLSYHRLIPDTRNKLCKDIQYQDDLPSASVIVCFYNEHLATLLRTLHSIVDRTPGNLLKEIILINDRSSIENLHSQVEDYVNIHLGKVKLIKTEKREGLIRARILGARKASGEVLIFLDSHIEVNVGWIEPLLYEIKQNKTTIVMPVIDVINPDTFAYTSSPLVRGGFNWGLHFKWENLPKGTLKEKSDFIKPIRSPTMAGGLFAIDKKYFVDLGEYDAGMNIWGGENLEISFRVWMCGGQIELIPCSRVGHIFRHRRPYGAPDGQDTMLYNSLRVATVWMDDYKKYFMEHRSDAKDMKFGDVTSRIQLRKELKCKNFDWYLQNVYPELVLPTDTKERLHHKWEALERDKFQPWHLRKRNYTSRFQLRLSGSGLCLQSAKDFKSKGSILVLERCSKTKGQMWYETDKHELVLAQLLCLHGNMPNPNLSKCHEMGGEQEWRHKEEDRSPIYNLAMGTCLGVEKSEIGGRAVLKLCSDTVLSMWDFLR